MYQYQSSLSMFGVGTALFNVFFNCTESLSGYFKLPPFINPIPKEYPFSFTNGVPMQHTTKLSVLVNKNFANNIQFQFFTSSVTENFNPLYPDVNPPVVQNISIIPLGAEKYLFRVEATDDLSGIYAIQLDSITTLLSQDLVSGNLNNGVFEKIVDGVNVYLPQRINFKAYDLAGNLLSPNFTDVLNLNLDLLPLFPVYEMLNRNPKLDFNKWTLISHFKFDKESIDLTEVSGFTILEIGFIWNNFKQPPKFILNRAPFTKNPTLEFNGIWNETSGFFTFEIEIPARLFEGPLSYTIIVPPFNYTQNDINVIFNNSLPTQLNITCKNSDLLPPMITDITFYPYGYSTTDVVQIPENIDDRPIGWDLRIKDFPNGFKSGLVEVVSDLDMEPYVFNLDPSKLVSGTEFDGVYPIRIPITGSTCASQRFWIKKVELKDSLGLESSNVFIDSNTYLINSLASFNSTIPDLYSIGIQCKTVYTGGLPSLESFSFTPNDTIDVTSTYAYQRTINFTFTVTDTKYGISRRHLPVIYLQTSFDGIISNKTTLIMNNFTHAIYQLSFEVPYGFGIGQGIVISVYGIVNNQLIFHGYSVTDLLQSLTIPAIKTTSLFSPLITGYEPIRDIDNKLTLYGNGFGINRNNVSILIGYGRASFQTSVPIGDLFSGLALSTNFTPYIGSKPFYIKVIVDGKESNPFLIIPKNFTNSLPTTTTTTTITTSTTTTNPSTSTTGGTTTSSTTSSTTSTTSTTTSTTSPSSSPIPTQQPINCIGNPLCGGPDNEKVVFEYVFSSWLLTTSTNGSDDQSKFFIYSSNITGADGFVTPINYGQDSNDPDSQYVKLQVDNYSLLAKYINYGEIDGYPRSIENKMLDSSQNPTQTQESQSFLGIKFPLHHYNISLDPDYSLILDYVNAKDKDGSNCSGSSNKLTKSQIAGIVIASVAGFLVITINGSRQCECSEKYYRDKTNQIISQLHNLIVSELGLNENGNRSKEKVETLDRDVFSYLSLDCITCPIVFPKDRAVAEAYYYGKKKINGLKYEVAVGLVTGTAYWVSGFHESNMPDFAVLETSGLLNQLNDNEVVMAGKQYFGGDKRLITTLKKEKNKFKEELSWIKHSNVLEDLEILLKLPKTVIKEERYLLIPSGLIPSSVKSLFLMTIGDSLITIEPGTIPISVENLSMSYKSLKLCKTCGLIPESIQKLTILGFKPKEGDSLLDYIIPKNLVLEFKDNCQNIVLNPSFFPDSSRMKSLEMYQRNTLSKIIEIPDKFIPNYVSNIELHGNIKPLSIPPLVTKLSIHKYTIPKDLPIIIPPNIKILNIDMTRYTSHLNVKWNKILQFDTLHSITHLECMITNIPINFLPPTLQKLKLNSIIKNISVGSIPPSVTELNFNSLIIVPLIEGILPQSLLKLVFGKGIYHGTKFPVIPIGLESLFIGSESITHYINVEIPPNSLPPSLLKLVLSRVKIQLFEQGILPPNLKTLKIKETMPGNYSNNRILILPNSIEYLQFPRSNMQLYLREYFPTLIDLISNKTNGSLEIAFKSFVDNNAKLNAQVENKLIEFVTKLDVTFMINREFVDAFLWIKQSSVLNELRVSLQLPVVEKEKDRLYVIPSESIPSSVKSLSLRTLQGNSIFKIEPGTIPMSVEYLVISYSSLQQCSTPGLIPPSIKELRIADFDPIEGDSLVDFIIPPKLRLENQSKTQNIVLRPGFFPKKSASLKSLEIYYHGEKFLEIPDGFIPEYIPKLELYGNIWLKPKLIPRSVKELSILYTKSPSLPRIPKKIKVLKIDMTRASNLFYDWNNMLKFGPLHSITHLECMIDKIPVNFLPPTVQTLILHSEIKTINIGSIPPSVTELHFNSIIIVPLKTGILPPSLLKLVFRKGIHHTTIFPVLPMGLKSLFIGSKAIDNYVNLEILPDSLPSSLLELVLSRIMIQSFEKGVLPPNLKSLKIKETMPTTYSRRLMVLPSSIEYLQFPRSNMQYHFRVLMKGLSMTITRLEIQISSFNELNRIPKGMIPKSSTLKELKISIPEFRFSANRNNNNNSIYQDILEEGSIPESIEILTIDNRFVKHNPLGLIPNTVRELNILGSNIEEGDINNYPSSVEKITLIPKYRISEEYYKSMLSTGCFTTSKQSSLIHLELNGGIPKICPGAIPSTVKYLKLRVLENSTITIGSLPDSLECLEMDLGIDLDYKTIFRQGVIPNGVKSIKVDALMDSKPQIFYQGSIPNTVTTLIIRKLTPSTGLLLQEGILPEGLTHLEIKEEWTPKTCLPPSLTYLNCNFDTIPKGLLPKTLKTLKLSAKMKEIDIGSIPESVTEISFYKFLNIPLVEGILPSSLTKLSMLNGLNTTSVPSIPCNVKTLELCIKNHPVPKLPHSIENLIIQGELLNQSLTTGILPPRLKSLDVSVASRFQLGEFEVNQLQFPTTIQLISFPLCLSRKQYSGFIKSVLLNSDNLSPITFQFKNDRIDYISFDKNDPYFYAKLYDDDGHCFQDGFMLKSSIDELQEFFRDGSFDPELLPIEEFKISLSDDNIEQFTLLIKHFTIFDRLNIDLNGDRLCRIPRGVISSMSLKYLMFYEIEKKNKTTVGFGGGGGGGIQIEDVLEPGSIPECVEIFITDHRLVRHNPIGLIPPSGLMDRGVIPDSGTYLELITTGNQKCFPQGFLNKVDLKKFSAVELKIPPLLQEDGILPEGLTHLDISENWTLQTRLPSTLTDLNCNFDTLQFSEIVKIPLVQGVLPSSLKVFTFGNSISDDVPFPSLPDQLTCLNFVGSYKHQVPNFPDKSLPETIETMKLTGYIKQLLSDICSHLN
eukprot:gene3088-3860_t